MNIATQAQTFLNDVLEKNPKWLELLFSRYLPLAVTALLIVMVAAKAAELTWRMVPAPEGSAAPAPQNFRKPLPAGNRTDDPERLAQAASLHLFGVAGATKPVSEIEMKAPETRLNLTLHGVFVEDDPALGAAIIGTSGSTQKYYKVGASVMSGVKLQAVFNDRVVLLRNGRSEVLRFPKVPNSGALASGVTGARAAAVSDSRSNANSTVSLSGYREEFQREPLKIFEHVRFVPVRSRDGLKGYRVLPQKNRELYNQLGIRPSDLVTSVNGITLTNDREAMKLIDTLKDASTIQVDIVRKGQPQSLTFNLN